MNNSDHDSGIKKDPDYKENEHIIKFRLPNGISLKLGDVVYAVELTGPQYFNGDCPCCNGVKPLLFKGFEFTCPQCNGRGNGNTVLKVMSYAVRRYRCARISESIDVTDWAPADGHPHNIELYFQRRVGKGTCYGDSGNFKLNSDRFGMKFFVHTERETTGTFKNFYREYDNPLYFAYADAVKAADKLNADEAGKVKSYNAQFGTTFEFNVPEYDGRSK